MKGIVWLSAIEQSPIVTPQFDNLAKHFHVTMAFGVSPDAHPLGAFLGREFNILAYSNAYNDRIQALEVALPVEIFRLCQNKFPHMTISMAHGVKPVESNTMLEDPQTVVGLDQIVKTVLEFQPFN